MNVDVVLPTLDPDPDRLEDSVSSILNQEDVQPHLIVVDDSESDTVEEYVTGRDESVTYLTGPGTTLAHALNEGVAAGDAPLVARQDADDVSLPRRLTIQRQEFERDDDLDLLGTGATVVRPSGDESRRRVIEHLDPEDFRGQNPIVHGSVMYRRESFEDCGGYDDRFPTTEDLELWIRMMDSGMTLRNIDSPLYRLQLHDDSIYADQLRETKLLGRFAEKSARGLTDPSTEVRVLDRGETESIYPMLSERERRQFHRDMALELLRYGNGSAARNHVIAGLRRQWWDVSLVGLLALTYTPRMLVNGLVTAARSRKNRSIAARNESRVRSR